MAETDITIPPEAVAGMRARLKVYFSGYQEAVIDEICTDAIRGALKAWPGMEVHVLHPAWRGNFINLPLPPQENTERPHRTLSEMRGVFTEAYKSNREPTDDRD